MAQQLPKTIACPVCANKNPYTQDECLGCGLDLRPIRQALEGGGAGQPSQPKQPPPPMPSLPSAGKKERLGELTDGHLLLVRGMADRRADVIAYFFGRLKERQIPDLVLSDGYLLIDRQQRDYFFVQKFLSAPTTWASMNKDPNGLARALATVCVRLAASGSDLMVEWRHFQRTEATFGAFMRGFTAGFFTLGASLLVDHSGRQLRLKGFEEQDSMALKLAVQASLEEAIDLAGIPKTLIQDVPEEKKKKWVI